MLISKNYTLSGVVVRACNPSNWQVETQGPGVQGHPYPHSKFKATLDYPSQNTHRVGWLSLSQVFDPEEHRASSMFFSYWGFDAIVIYTGDVSSINPRHRMTEACSRPFRELWLNPKPQSIQQFVVLLFWNRVSRGPGWPWTCSVAIPASCNADHKIQGFMCSRQVLY